MKIYSLSLVFSLLFITACGHSQQVNEGQVRHVKASEFNEIIKSGNGQLIDLRTPKEFNAGHIAGASMIDFYAPTFKEYLNKLDKETPIYIYCRSGSRSSKSIGLLVQLGFTEIVNLQRGIIDWQRAGYTVTTN